MQPRYIEELDKETIKKLEYIRRKGKNSKERERSHAILLSNKRLFPKDLAKQGSNDVNAINQSLILEYHS